MVRRVVIGDLPGGGYGIRVSRPSADVLSTGLAPKQVAFDSRWERAERIFAHGTTSLPTTSSVAYKTVSFGETLSAVPEVIFLKRLESESDWRGPEDAGGAWSSNGDTEEPVRVFNNRVEFRRPLTGIGAEVVSYIILRP